jgi:hypothetical protein
MFDGEGRFTRGWRLAGQSWAVIRGDRKLLVVPALALCATLAASAVIFGPAFYWIRDSGSRLPLLVAAAIAAYPLTFLATYFGVVFVAIAERRVAGEDATLADGFAAARGRLGAIAAWSLVATAVGLALRGLEQIRGVGGLAARIVSWILGAAWSLAIIFVIPVIALEGPGPIDAFRRSASVFRSRWAEGATGTFVVGAATALLYIPIAIVAMIGVAMLPSGVGAVVIALAVALGVLVTAWSAAVSQLFRLALYHYAVDGTVRPPFSEGDFMDAFTRRRTDRASWSGLPPLPPRK